MALRSKYSNVQIPVNVSWPEFVFENFEDYENRTAIVCGSTNTSYTFSEVKNFSRKFCSALNQRGIKKGDVVAILAPNVPEFAIVFLGVLQLGAVVTSVNPHFTSKELINQLREANAKCIIAVHQLVHRAKEAEEELQTGHVIVIGEDDQCVSLSEILNGDGEISSPVVELNPEEDLAILPFSSGSSGLPKGVMITHQNLIALGSIVKSEGMLNFNENSKILTLIPFYRAFGMIAVLSMSLRMGSTLISVPRFDDNMHMLCHLLQYYKVTHLITETSTVHLLARQPGIEKFQLSSLTEVISTACLLTAEISKKLQKRIPHLKRITQCYGLTESTAVSHMTPATNAKHGSVGTLLPNLECKVVDPKTKQNLGVGQRGEICIRGPTLMKGYLNNQKASELSIDQDGWLHTGDIGYYDEDEHFVLVNKLKDLIKFRGHQISPSELETLLRAHPGIKDAVVVGIPDPEAGEVPMAYVVSKHDDELTEIEVMEYVDENAAPYKKLRGGVEFISAIPKNMDGQVLRAELVERQRNGNSSAVLRRRSSVLHAWKEEKRFSIKRFSLTPNTRPRDIGPIAEEKPATAARSQSCVLL
ncbi:uncharacterized protein [Montipora capricornis]|uniref:uncharacterized protein n=1 Tax=Montipora capricornis TaxID=246305 RepID=UPI0035F15F32